MTMQLTKSERRKLVRALMEAIDQMAQMADKPGISATNRMLCNGHVRTWTSLMKKVTKGGAQ